MKQLFLITLISIFFANIQLSQGQNDIIYRIEGQPESPLSKSYIVGVLFLKEDGSYLMKHQEYNSKKMMKKNIMIGLEEEKGFWKKEKNVFILKDSTSGRNTKFLIKNQNKIAIIIRDSEASSSNWMKIE